MSELILAMIYDRTAILQWYQTENGHQGIDPPEQLTAKLLGIESENDKDENILSFDNGEDFETRRKKILEGDEMDGDGTG